MRSTTGHPGPLPLTGERTTPGVPHENYWFQRHVAAYAVARSMAAGKRVVDAGSGEGYGAAMLAEVATSCVGVELVPEVVDHARAAYPDVTFRAADVCDTGLPHGDVDLVVSLQVIEHLPDVPRFLAEQRRILRPGGKFVVATPNRLTFTPDHDHPVNVFHVEEFTDEELASRLSAVGFEVVGVLGLHHGPLIRAKERVTGCPFNESLLDPPEEWPAWLRTTVARIRPTDFVWSDTDTAGSLDLLAVART